MARDAVDAAPRAGEAKRRPSATADLPLHGALPLAGACPRSPPGVAREHGISDERRDARSSTGTGRRRRGVGCRRCELPTSLRPARRRRSRILEAEVAWAADHELALGLDDVLARRIRLVHELPRPRRVDRAAGGRDPGASGSAGTSAPGGRGRRSSRTRARVRLPTRRPARPRARSGWWIRPASAALSRRASHGWLPISSSRSTRARPRRARSPSTARARRSPSAQREFPQRFPSPGHVTHDPEEIWSSQLAVAREVVAAVGGAGAGRRHRHHEPARDDHRLGPRDRPARRAGDRLAEPDHRPVLRAAPGRRPRAAGPRAHRPAARRLLLAARRSATSSRTGGLRARAERGELAFGTVDAFLVWRLTGGRVHATDVSNASRTLLFDIHTLDWDDELLRLMEVPRAMLPEVRPSSARLGRDRRVALRPPDPDRGRRRRPAGGDVRAGVLRARARRRTRTAPGAFLLANIGDAPVASRHGLLTTVLWQLGERRRRSPTRSRARCSSPAPRSSGCATACGAIATRRGGRGAVRGVEDTGGVYLVPAFVGPRRAVLGSAARGA